MQGFSVSDVSVRWVVSAWRGQASQPGVPGIPLPAKEEVIFYSTRKTRWLLCKPIEDLSEREAVYITALKQLCPPIAHAQQLLNTFRNILT